MVKHWNKLSRVVDARSPELFKIILDGALNNLSMSGVLELADPKCPFQPKPLYDSMNFYH